MHDSQLTKCSSWRELHQLVASTESSESPFHVSHKTGFTDATVYPAPPSSSDEPELKKRKRTAETSTNGIASASTASNDAAHARYPNLMVANKYNVELHEILKRECEQLAQHCVLYIFPWFSNTADTIAYRTKSSFGWTWQCPSECIYRVCQLSSCTEYSSRIEESVDIQNTYLSHTKFVPVFQRR